MSIVRRHLTYANVIATLALVAAVGGGSYAVAASSGGTIKACAKKRVGTLRLASKCRKSERPISWNAVGPAGPAGPAGAPGAPGAAGAAGKDGKDGASAVAAVASLPAWGGQLADTSSDFTFRQHRELGTFTKQSATTHAVVTIGGSLSSDAFSCLVQVRVDGKDASGATATSANTSHAGATGVRGPGAPLQAPYSGEIVQPFSITADFGTLAAGTHTVTLWTASNSASNNCTTDPYNYRDGSTVVLEVGT
jgi:hypothetical protein